MLPLDLGPDLDIALGWDWLSSHDLCFLYPQGHVAGAGPQGALSAPLRPATARAMLPQPVLASVLIGLDSAMANSAAFSSAWYLQGPRRKGGGRRWPIWPRTRRDVTGGISKPLDPLGTPELAEADRQRQLRRAQRRSGLAPQPLLPRFVDGTALLDDSTVLHLSSLRFTDASIALEGQDHRAFAELKAECADVLGGPQPGLPLESCIKLVLPFSAENAQARATVTTSQDGEAAAAAAFESRSLRRRLEREI